MNCDIFVPIRLTNTRLPQKALRELHGKPIIHYLIERLRYATKIRHIVVCTTTLESDNPLVEFLEKNKIKVFRGNEKDILVRFLDAAKQFDTNFFVNVDGDDIYTDPAYIDKIVDEFQKTNTDFIDMIGFPFGLRSVGITINALQKICDLKKTNDTETGYRNFFTKIKLFNTKNIVYDLKTKFPDNLRLSLDYQEDFDLAEVIFKTLGNNFHLLDLLKLFEEKPELLKITDRLVTQWNEHWNTNLTDLSIRDM